MPDVTTNNPAETEEIGRRLGERLRPGDVVLLTGELGAGKTTLVRGVAQGIGSKAPVASPTFQLVRIYPGRVQLAHVDLYRVRVAGELADLGLDELIDEGAVVVEWGDRIEARSGRVINFDTLDGDRRRISMNGDPGH